MDAGIASWYQKYKCDSHPADLGDPAPRRRASWSAPGSGRTRASAWWTARSGCPTSTLTVVTPPFPEYVSGHSTFSSAGAKIMQSLHSAATPSARTSRSRRARRSSSRTPRPTDVVFTWPTFTNTLDDAGLSRRIGGIHFAQRRRARPRRSAPRSACTSGRRPSSTSPAPLRLSRTTKGPAAGRQRALRRAGLHVDDGDPLGDGLRRRAGDRHHRHGRLGPAGVVAGAEDGEREGVPLAVAARPGCRPWTA